MGENQIIPKKTKEKEKKEKYIYKVNKVLVKHVPNGDRYYRKWTFNLLLFFFLKQFHRIIPCLIHTILLPLAKRNNPNKSPFLIKSTWCLRHVGEV